MIVNNDMYYDRTLSEDFASLIEEGGELRWLFEFVKNRKDLDFLIGKNASKEWISVYRGLSRVLKIEKTNDSKKIKIDGAKSYKALNQSLYGTKSIYENFKDNLISLLEKVEKDEKFDSYYKNKKEGYFQNEISRKYGILSEDNADFVILDKEVVVGYINNEIKEKYLNDIKDKNKKILAEISKSNSKRFGKNLESKSVGNELDFLALDKEGNVLLVELKHDSNTQGIYLSPLQIGTYYEIFSRFEKQTETFEETIFAMLKQKQKIGLINPKWKKPNKIKDIIPVLIVADYNYETRKKNSRYDTIGKFNEILGFVRDEFGTKFSSNLKACNYTEKEGLNTGYNNELQNPSRHKRNRRFVCGSLD